jgi:hypothetical protein
VARPSTLQMSHYEAPVNWQSVQAVQAMLSIAHALMDIGEELTELRLKDTIR